MEQQANDSNADAAGGSDRPKAGKHKVLRAASAIAAAVAVTAGGILWATQANAGTQPVSAAASADGGRHGGRGAGDGGFGNLGHTLHGEYVVAEADATDTTGAATRVIRVQTGEVIALDATTIGVRSVDGFSATYLLGTVEVADVAVGDTVFVQAEVAGETVTALRVREKGARRSPRTSTSATTGSTTGSSTTSSTTSSLTAPPTTTSTTTG